MCTGLGVRTSWLMYGVALAYSNGIGGLVTAVPVALMCQNCKSRCLQDHGGLAKFLNTPLFFEDISVFCCGPGDIRVLLRPHLASLMAPNFQYS